MTIRCNENGQYLRKFLLKLNQNSKLLTYDVLWILLQAGEPLVVESVLIQAGKPRVCRRLLWRRAQLMARIHNHSLTDQSGKVYSKSCRMYLCPVWRAHLKPSCNV